MVIGVVMVKSEGLSGSDGGNASWLTRYVSVSMSGRMELGTEGLAGGTGEEGWVGTGA